MLPIAEPQDTTTESMILFYKTLRKTLLEQVDAIERLLNISPRTAELRKVAKHVVESEAEKKEGNNVSP